MTVREIIGVIITSFSSMVLPALFCLETGRANRLLFQKHHLKQRGWQRDPRITEEPQSGYNCSIWQSNDLKKLE